MSADSAFSSSICGNRSYRGLVALLASCLGLHQASAVLQSCLQTKSRPAVSTQAGAGLPTSSHRKVKTHQLAWRVRRPSVESCYTAALLGLGENLTCCLLLDVPICRIKGGAWYTC